MAPFVPKTIILKDFVRHVFSKRFLNLNESLGNMKSVIFFKTSHADRDHSGGNNYLATYTEIYHANDELIAP